jgi:hypothetical protein
MLLSQKTVILHFACSVLPTIRYWNAAAAGYKRLIVTARVLSSATMQRRRSGAAAFSGGITPKLKNKNA